MSLRFEVHYSWCLFRVVLSVWLGLSDQTDIFLPIHWRGYSLSTCHGDGMLLVLSVCNKGLDMWTHVLFPTSLFLLPGAQHMHGLWKCRVVSIASNLPLLGTCGWNWYAITFQAKKYPQRTSNTLSMKLQAAVSLCCEYQVPVPPPLVQIPN